MTPFDEIANRQRVDRLREYGVEVWGAERVYIGPEVPLGSIQPGAVLINAIINGSRVAIGAKSRIGISGNATIRDCDIGENVEIGAGFFDRATLLDGVKVRGFAEVREGTLLEEKVELGHNVGLKNTVFTAAVVAGSLINFCDAFVTGGTSRSDHSEIGSGTVHFNFDPRGDKFGSVFGDPTGVLLRARRIFVGGNCGLVAPLHCDFGSVLAAGSTIRKDIGPNNISYGDSSIAKDSEFEPSVYSDIRRKFVTTAKLVGAMQALREWYKQVRVPFAGPTQEALYQSAEVCLASHISHRVSELNKVIFKIERSLSAPDKSQSNNPFALQHRLVIENREKIESLLACSTGIDSPHPPKSFVENYARERATQSHLDAIRNLTPQSVGQAATWVLGIAARIISGMEQILAGSKAEKPN